MPVGGDRPRGAGLVFAAGAALGAVAGVGTTALFAFAAAAGVAADGAVPVLPPGRVRRRQPQLHRFGDDLQMGGLGLGE